eukprot:84977_1
MGASQSKLLEDMEQTQPNRNIYYSQPNNVNTPTNNLKNITNNTNEQTDNKVEQSKDTDEHDSNLELFDNINQQLQLMQKQLENAKSKYEQDKKKHEIIECNIESTNKENERLKQMICEQEQKYKDFEELHKNMSENMSENKSKIEYPNWWDLKQLNTLKYGQPKLIELDIKNSVIAKEIMNSFYATVNNQTIIKIEYVINQMLYDKWWNERETLAKLIGNNKLNIRNLFHGTKNENTMNFIIKEGFRKEFNKSAAIGKGTYLAKNAKYSVGYSSNNNGLKKMFQCKVICGEMIKGCGSYQLTSWPKKSSGLIYDSLVSNVKSPTTFVIHENYRIYPMFIIHFNACK